MANVIYLSHGGGPLPILGEPSHNEMVTFLKKTAQEIKKPDAIIVISAHWEEKLPTIVSSKSPSLLYDYYGFPSESYDIKYQTPDNTELANRIKNVFESSNMPIALDENRGLDHGVFIPMMLMYPEADIPVTQISLVKGLDPLTHISIGKVLNKLSHENILIIGSGFSFHNLREFDWDGKAVPDEKNNSFQDWLIEICVSTKYSQQESEKRLIEWGKAPNANYCHPREEHLIPLHVCFGTSEKKGKLIFDNYILGKRAVAISWEMD